jgi:hypothetical protein
MPVGGKREEGRGKREEGTGNREQGTGNREDECTPIMILSPDP